MADTPGFKTIHKIEIVRDPPSPPVPFARFPIKTVYLSGPITGLTYGEAKDTWRPAFAKLLPAHILPYSPLRVAAKRLNDQGLIDMPHLTGVPALLEGISVMGRDENDLRTTDAMVAFLKGAHRVSIGTVGEINQAHILRKPVILVMDNPDPWHEHPFVTAPAIFRTDSMEEAAEYVAHLLTPGV